MFESTEVQPVESTVMVAAPDAMAEFDAAVRAHRPVNWLTPGYFPSCSCGLNPRDNEVLIQHWNEQGIEWVETRRSLVARVAL